MPTSTLTNPGLAKDLLDVLDVLSGGVQPGLRPAHAKGLMCAGTFTPSPEAAKLTRASHASRPSTPVTVRYSNGTGLPTIPDNDPARSGPRGIAIRFHLADHVAHRHHRALDERLSGPHRRGVRGVPPRRGGRRGWEARGARSLPRLASEREAVRRDARSRSRRASRARRSSPSRRSSSRTPTARAATGASESGRRLGRSISPTPRRREAGELPR